MSRRSFLRGEKVEMLIRLRNDSDHPIESRREAGGPAHDFWVAQGDKNIWIWSYRLERPGVPETDTFNQGEETTRSVVWDQKVCNLGSGSRFHGDPPLPGKLLVQGLWDDEDGVWLSNSLEIEITD